MRAVLVAFVLASLVFAGCTGDKPGDNAGASGDPTGALNGVLEIGEGEPGIAIDPEAGFPAPVWNVGDWWEYDIAYTSGESFTSKVVVAADDGTNYLLTSDNRDLVARASFTHYPTFGPVTKADLKHKIHGADVSFLQFPVKNASYEMPFRQDTFAMTTSLATLETGRGPVEGFATTMRNVADGRIRISHGWSPEAKYFTNLTFDFDGTAPIDVTFTLKDWGSNFTGTLPVLEFTDLVDRIFPVVPLPPVNPENPQPPAPPANEPQDRFTLAEGTTLFVGIFAASGGAASFEVDIGPLSGQAQPGYSFPYRPQAAGAHFEWHDVADISPGDWGILATGAVQFGGFLFVETFQVTETEIAL